MSDDIVARLVRRVEELRKYQRIAAELSDKFNGTPCAEIRWQQELDAAIARAEAAERERDEALRLRYCAEDDAAIVKEQYDALLKNSTGKIAAAEAKVAKLREALAETLAVAARNEEGRFAERARAVLQETEQ